MAAAPPSLGAQHRGDRGKLERSRASPIKTALKFLQISRWPPDHDNGRRDRVDRAAPIMAASNRRRRSRSDGALGLGCRRCAIRAPKYVLAFAAAILGWG